MKIGARGAAAAAGMLALLFLLASWLESIHGAPAAPRPRALRQAPAAAEAPAPAAAKRSELPPARSFGEAMGRGDAAAASADYRQALLDWRRGFEFYLAEQRGLAFRYDVGCAFMGRAELRKFMREMLDRELPPEMLSAMRKQLCVLGFSTVDFDPARELPEILTQEVGGFYDPSTRAMRLISEVKEGGAAPKSSLGKLFRAFEFSPEEQKAILVHEMDHALADQWWDLEGIQHAVLHDDDASLAVTSLVEGEATVVMFAQMSGLDGDFLQSSPDAMRSHGNVLGALMATAGGPALQKAPKIIGAMLVFPYFQGGAFVLSLTNRDGTWAPIDKAFAAPPTSTEQILHPEKYAAGNDPPLAADLGAVAARAGPAWKVAAANTVGEMGFEALLRERLGEPAAEIAAGWGGDSYVVLEHEDGTLALVLRTTWDSEPDAASFADAWRKTQRIRSAAAAGAEPPAAVEPLAAEHAARHGMRAGSALYLDHSGRDVLVIEGIDAATCAAVAKEALIGEWRVKKFEFPAPRPR
ncbi:MAG: hypothetical protein L0Z55_09730 [Planctomycetes bacterium]|nr:hypothetical protein [Planctomycetota bacterium]